MSVGNPPTTESTASGGALHGRLAPAAIANGSSQSLLSAPRRDFVDVVEQIRGIRVDAKRAGAREFFLAVAARQQTHAERPCALRGDHVPDAVAQYQRVADIHAEAGGRR